MINAIADRTRSVQPDQSQGKTALRIFPILGPSHDKPPYRLLEGDALSAVKVTETSPSGSVPELKVENSLDVRVFLMDGQELVGAKQNRILNTDVLVPAKTTLTIPVSCVEAGRWRHTSDARTIAAASLFQSTLPRGERHEAWVFLCEAPMFQSTLPRGERPKPPPSWCAT